jgi:hypothetical protein
VPPLQPPTPCDLVSVSPYVIEVDGETYHRISWGELVQIPYEVSVLAGEKFKVVNRENGNYIFRTLQAIIDNYGLFR